MHKIKKKLGSVFAVFALGALVFSSCNSGPDEATQQAFTASQTRMESARKQAQDFGAAEYATDEWNLAELQYTTANEMPLSTKKDYLAVIPQFDTLSLSYESVFAAALPQYTEARKNTITSVRQEAVNAGAETSLKDALAAADSDDANSLILLENQDYYGYQTASFLAEKSYEVLTIEGNALAVKDTIIANNFARFDPDTIAAADQSVAAANTAFADKDMDAAQTAADDALAKYQTALANGWKGYAGEQQPLAEQARTNAVALHADTVLKDAFAAADAVYNQGTTDLDAGNFEPAADAFVQAQPLFASLARDAGALRNTAQAAIRTPRKRFPEQTRISI